MGERQIKELKTYYLPQQPGMDDAEYDDFLSRATYFNFSSRTVNSMSGSIFRRQPLVEGFTEALKLKLQTIAKDATDFDTFSSGACEEVVKLGRYGVLVDLPPAVTTSPRPYLCGYTAENILDWDEGTLDSGDTAAVRIILRETNDGRNFATDARQSYVRYRELVLLPNPQTGKLEYCQFVYSAVNADATLDEKFRGPAIVPLMKGEPLNFIPFQLFGPHLSSWSVEKPPLDDIAMLNLSHYRSYASLEHGRFYVGFPVYTAEEPTGGGTIDYKVGPSRVWIMPPGGTARILEMNGQGLKFLENALTQKEMQAVSIGSKMLGAGGPTPAKGADQLILEERNEQSVLLKITRQMDKGFTNVLRWWAQWAGASVDEVKKIQITFNKDFLFDAAGAREFRAIHAMYKDGVLPIEVVFYYFKKSYLIPDWMMIEEFKSLLEKTGSFPGQPDAEARARGFKDRQQELSHEEKLAGIDIQQQEIDLQIEVQDAADEMNAAKQVLAEKTANHTMAMDKAKQKLAEKAAKKAAEKPAVPPGAPGGGGGGGAPPKGGGPAVPGGVQPPPKIAPPAVAMAGVKPSGRV
jgi:hypothetical protein